MVDCRTCAGPVVGAGTCVSIVQSTASEPNAVKRENTIFDPKAPATSIRLQWLKCWSMRRNYKGQRGQQSAPPLTICGAPMAQMLRDRTVAKVTAPKPLNGVLVAVE